MYNNYIVIKCKSYLYVTTKLLSFEDKYLHSYESVFENTTFLILARYRLSQLQISKIIRMGETNFKNDLYGEIRDKSYLNLYICYSFRTTTLDSHRTPYKYLADTILSLPYKFTKAKIHEDTYGNMILLLIN